MNHLPLRPLALAIALGLTGLAAPTAFAQEATRQKDENKDKDTNKDGAPSQLPAVTVSATADKQGLSKAYAGGQVARGGRAGILGTKDNMETPFSITAYTNELIQDRQAKSVAEVLQNDPGVRAARGFGNFQEAYFIRGFILTSDDVAYNGLYSLLPRQYIASELFERVEVLRGASAFLMGASPGGSGIGGNVSLLPKRAPAQPLNRVTVGIGDNAQRSVSADVARRFGPDNATGVRVNAAMRDGGTAVDGEKNKLGLFAVGLDWRSRNVRLSGDIGYQDNQLKDTRTSVTLPFGATAAPAVPDGERNFSQPWTYSNERDVFGTVRGEWDLSSDVTAWAAYGFRHNTENNSLAGLTLSDVTTGAGTTSRFDNARRERVNTGEAGVRGKLRTGGIGHEWVVSASYFESKERNAYVWDYFNTQATNLYQPVYSPLPAYSNVNMFRGNDLADPALFGVNKLTSVAIGDTLSMLDDTLLLTLGLRHQKLDYTGYAYDTGAVSASYDKSRTSPVAGAVYKVSKQVSVYGNYIQGMARGDTYTSGTGASVTGAPYLSKQKEVGVKVDTGRLGLGLALFTTDKPRYLKFGQAQPQGKDRHNGAELTVYGEATQGLRVLGGVTLLDTKQRNTGDPTTEGKETLGIPKLQGNLGVDWDVAGVNGLAVDARLLHTGKVYADSANLARVPAWTRLDVGARYQFEVQNTLLTLRARVDNVTNRQYWSSAGGYPDQGYLVLGMPRSVNLSLAADF